MPACPATSAFELQFPKGCWENLSSCIKLRPENSLWFPDSLGPVAGAVPPLPDDITLEDKVLWSSPEVDLSALPRPEQEVGPKSLPSPVKCGLG